MRRNEFKELEKCFKDPWYFLTGYVKTFDRLRGERLFPDWNYLKNLVRTFERERLIVILKSRQMLVSWIVVAYVLWECIFRGYSDNLFISRKLKTAQELLWRARFIYRRLPEYMKVNLGYNNKNVLELKGTGSRMISLPADPEAGRTYSPKRVIIDEFGFVPYAEEIFNSLQPALDGGGKFIGISTSNGSHTKHGQLYLNAEKEGFCKIDVHYSLHPEKDEEWKKEAQKGISQETWDREQEMNLDVGGNRVYKNFLEKRNVMDCEYNQEYRSFRSIDFGYHTPYVLWAQMDKESNIYLLREWVGEDNTIFELIEEVKRIDKEIGIDERDIEMTFCDPAGAQKRDEGISSIERLKKAGIKVSYINCPLKVGIDLVREKILSSTGEVSLFFSPQMKRMISDIKGYVLKKNSDEPLKDDITSHSMDALRYLITNLYIDKHKKSKYY
ncbi:hypothetical protein DRQ09_02435, partial [candidate division KSB1 bacterium]